MTVVKSIVVLLVLANAGYFLWARGIAGSAEEPAQPPMSTLLKLASEASPGVTAPPAASAGAAPSGGSSAASGVPVEFAGGASRCVSVGPFREPADAARAAGRLRGDGLESRQRITAEATVADRKRTGTFYWLDVDLKPADPMLDPAEFQGDKDHAARVEVMSCPAAEGATG